MTTHVVELLVVRAADSIKANCFDCHRAKRPDEIAHKQSAGEISLKRVRAMVAAHTEGHRVNIVIGRKPKL